MIPLIVEAATRSLALAVILWLIMVITRTSNPYLQKLVWTTVLLSSLAMPLLLRAHIMPPVIHTPDYVLTLHGAPGARIPTSHAWWDGVAVLYSLIALALLCRFTMNLLRMWRVRRNASVLNESWLARFHTCLFWFNPLAWWLQRRLATLAEVTSDDAAATTLADPATYAEILLELARERAASSVATAEDCAAVRDDELRGACIPLGMESPPQKHRAQSDKQAAGDIVDGPQRQPVGKRLAEKYHRRVGE
jgi:hypothetical protein